MATQTSHWEQSGAIYMPSSGHIHYERHLARLLKNSELDSSDGPMMANAPFRHHEGVPRLVINSDPNGTVKMPVKIEANAHTSQDVIFTSVELEASTMGRPLLGCVDNEVRSHFGDPISHDVGITAIKATLFDRQYGMLSLEKSGSSRISNDVTPEEVIGFMNICFDVVRMLKARAS